MLYVHEFMNRNFNTLRTDSTFRDAVFLFRREKTGIIPIVDETGKLRAALTQYSLYQSLIDNYPLDGSITPYTIKSVVTIHEDDTLDNVRDFLTQHQVAHAIVVTDDYKVSGILGRADIMRVSREISRSSRERTKILSNALETLVENLPTGVIALDQSGMIHVMNKVAQQMCGSSYDLAIGKHIFEVVPALKPLIDSLRHNIDTPQRKIEMQQKQILVHAKSLLDEEHLWGSLIILQDITKYEKIAEQLAAIKQRNKTLQTIVDQTLDGIMFIDNKGKIALANDALENLVKRKKEQLIGEQVKKVFPQLQIENLFMDEADAYELEAVTINDAHVILTKIPLKRNKETSGVIVTFTYKNLPQWKDVLAHLGTITKEGSNERGEMAHENSEAFPFHRIVTEDKRMVKIIEKARQIAPSFSNVLLLGESGTGKELFAQGIHVASKRPGKFVSMNCAAVPLELWEAEFFGYEEGAFTNARRGGKPGKFELADHGTLFLDEIGDMPLAAQVKLLRVLQEREFERIGGTKSRKVDVRIIVATNKNLEQLVSEGEFREDLYYRLNVIPIYLPPLRARKEDIPLLTKTISQNICRLLKIGPITISTEVEHIFFKYDWPGNIRELENVLEYAINMLSGKVLRSEHLPNYLLKAVNTEKIYVSTITHDFVNGEHANGTTFSNLNGQQKDLFIEEHLTAHGNSVNNTYTDRYINGNMLDGNFYKKEKTKAEIEAIERAIRLAGGNKTQAAKLLGISRSYLYKKLQTYKKMSL